MITERQQNLLRIIIESYVEEAQPVASGFLAAKLKEKVSSATIRNEMVALEKSGFIEQPHTSAGRIPTEKAYNFYVQNLMERSEECKLKIKSELNRSEIKELAKEIAELTNETIIVAFEKNDIYYTGISNLFSKVEFEDRNLLIDTSKVIDHLEAAVEEVFEEINEIRIFIGTENPFGTKCSAVVAPINFENKGLFVVMGPMRMNYAKVLTIINKISDKLK